MSNIINLALTKALIEDSIKESTEEFKKEVGPKGDRGEQGLRGLQGPKGDRGLGGLSGPKGDQGFKGPSGDKGIQGKQGPKGPKGDQGLRGLRGFTGDQGPKGDQGHKGDKGERGVSISKATITEDGQLQLSYTDGRILNVGKVQVNIDYKGGSGNVRGLPIEHYAIRDAEFLPNNSLVLYGNDGKKINAGAPNLAAGSYTWADYVNGPSQIPTLLTTLAGGPVYEYTYGATTLYRYIPDANPYDEAFYSSFDGTNLSDVVIARSITL